MNDIMLLIIAISMFGAAIVVINISAAFSLLCFYDLHSTQDRERAWLS